MSRFRQHEAGMSRLLSAAVVLLIGSSYLAQESRPKGLEGYVDKDLRKLDKRAAEEFRKHVEALTADKPEKEEWRSFESWWVKPFAKGDVAWVFLEAYLR